MGSLTRKLRKARKTMRTFTVPGTQFLDEEKTKPYTFANFLAEFLWPAEEFRTGSLDAIEILESLEEKLKDPKEGDEVSLTDKEYEFVLPILTLKGKPILPQFAKQLNRMMRPVIKAKRTEAQ